MSEHQTKPDLKSGFAGVFPANPTPLTEHGEIHEAALRAILEDNMSYGVHGFWIAGTSGEGPLLSEQQRDTVARIAGETTKGRALSIMNVGAITTDSAQKGAQSAVRGGCAAVACLPPFFPIFRSEASLIDHYQAVADSAEGLPVFAYNIPALTQVEFDRDLMENLQKKVPSLIGLKHSAYDLSMIQHWVDMGLACFSGFGRLPLPALDMGAVGTVDSPLSISPWLYVELYNAWKAGNLNKAKANQQAVQPVNKLVWRHDAVPDVLGYTRTAPWYRLWPSHPPQQSPDP
jgi:N-acetylneuraminate lyase